MSFAPSTFRIVVLGEFVARPDYSIGKPPPSGPLAIDKQSFDDALRALSPSVAFEVGDPLEPTEPPLRVELNWQSLRAFKPDAIVAEVPPLKALEDAWRIVHDTETKGTSLLELRGQFARLLPRPSWLRVLERGAAAKARGTAASPRISDLPTAPGQDALSGSLLESLLATSESSQPFEASRSSEVDRGASQTLAKACDQLLSDILHHPEVRRLEAAWRGLRLLVDHVDPRAGVEIDLVSASLDEVTDRMVAIQSRARSDSARAPVDVFVIDHEIVADAYHLGLLEQWGAIAEQMYAPILGNAQAELLGFDTLSQLAKSTRRIATTGGPEAVAFRSVTANDAARWIALALNGVVVRAPYDTTTSRLRSIPFEQDPSDRASMIYAPPAYVLAAVAAKSHARTGWPCAFTGAHDGKLDNLGVHTALEQEPRVDVPTEVFATIDIQREVSRAGITLIGSAPNHDAAIVSFAPVLFRDASRAAGGDLPSASLTLSDQLFVARLYRAVEEIASQVSTSTDPSTVTQVALLILGALFQNTAPVGPQIEAKVDSDSRTLHVTVHPRRHAGIGVEEITLSVKLN